MPKIKERKQFLISTAGEAVNYRDSWRIFKIITEFVEGYQFLTQFKKEVTILGSARLPKNNKYYQIAEDLGRLLGKNKFTTITGGGPGIMEASNKGAAETGGESVGLNIQLPMEQRTNAYVNKSVAFNYFFTRKVILTSPANAFAFFPGGFGTLDEFFEVADYIEMGQMEKTGMVLVGKDFWEHLMNFLKKKSMEEAGAVSASDLKGFHIVDDADSAFAFIKKSPDRPPALPAQGGGSLEWMIFRIMAELVDGFEFLTKVKDDVTVLGTKSILPGTPYYQAAYEVGKILAKNKFSVVTGGGPGVMEAASKGAFEAGGESIGINMRFERGERRNNYLTRSIGFYFPFVRKLIITAPSKGFVFFPGGFGTLHQLFELLTLIETRKIAPVPIILYGSRFWQPLLDYIHKLFVDFKTISQEDELYIRVIDRPRDVLEYLK
ncbi:TIGR00730 family Rossman fold protein [Patescibacteria group bacterium]|nr:TIGR00730 family Rossman fold protein [Patescibacteria group bacterium]